MSTRYDVERPKGRWVVFAVCVAASLAYLAIGLARREIGLVIGGPVVMLGYGAVLMLLGRRSEFVGLLAGSGSDERRVAVQLRASAATGQVLVLALVGGAIWTLAIGSSDAQVYCGLAAVGGITFAASTAWFSRHG